MSLGIRSLAAVLAFVLLAGGAAQAVPLSGPSLGVREEGGLLDAVWGWVASVVRSSAALREPIPGLDGSGVRGDGPAPGSQPVSKAGGMMDPDGEK
jgi:hypothetical protein